MLYRKQDLPRRSCFLLKKALSLVQIVQIRYTKRKKASGGEDNFEKNTGH